MSTSSKDITAIFLTYKSIYLHIVLYLMADATLINITQAPVAIFWFHGFSKVIAKAGKRFTLIKLTQFSCPEPSLHTYTGNFCNAHVNSVFIYLLWFAQFLNLDEHQHFKNNFTDDSEQVECLWNTVFLS